MVHGYLDANSSYVIFVSNVNWSEKEEISINAFKKTDRITVGENRANRYAGLEGLILFKENVERY